MAAARLLLIAALLPLGVSGPLRADGLLNLPLSCKVRSEPWQPCTLSVVRMGEHWWLQLPQQRFEFRSDGRGSVRLWEGTRGPQTVVPSWTAQQVLCWDGICAKGELPLD